VHYVVDQNREPTRDDDKYTGAIEVQPGQTIRVRAFRAGMDPSETLVLRYEDATQVEPQETPPDEGDETPADETAPADAETPAGGQNETPAEGGQGDESPSPGADGENEGDANG
jgi:hypothetical protein